MAGEGQALTPGLGHFEKLKAELEQGQILHWDSSEMLLYVNYILELESRRSELASLFMGIAAQTPILRRGDAVTIIDHGVRYPKKEGDGRTVYLVEKVGTKWIHFHGTPALMPGERGGQARHGRYTFLVGDCGSPEVAFYDAAKAFLKRR